MQPLLNRVITLTLLSSLSLSAIPAAGQDVDVDLVGGKVRGFIEGFGTAYVTARVTNNSDRPLLGATIAAYFSMLGTIFGEPDAKSWRYHKVRFRPPLAPGASKIVKFTDSEGASYVSLRIAKPEFAPYPPSAWVGATKVPSMMVGGRLFVALRDASTACGWTLGLGRRKGEVIVTAGGREITVSSGRSASASKSTVQAIERSGRTYASLADLSKALGFAISHTKDLNQYEVSMPKPSALISSDVADADAAPVLSYETPDTGPDWPQFDRVRSDSGAKPDPEWLDYTDESAPLSIDEGQIHIRGRVLQPVSDTTCRIAATWMRLSSGDPIQLVPPYLVVVRVSDQTRCFSASGEPADPAAIEAATHIEVTGPKPGDRQPIDAGVVVTYSSDAR